MPGPAQAAGVEATAGAGFDLELADELFSAAGGQPMVPETSPESLRYDDNGFPEDSRGILAVSPDGEGYVVRMRGVSFPYLLYAQFVNRQRDAVFLAREGLLRDPLPDGTLKDIPYGYGALKTTSAYLSVVEAIVLPHVSDNQKDYRQFPLQDLYLGLSLGVTGLLVEARYIEKERLFGHARVGLNFLGGAGGVGLAPLNYSALRIHLGAGVAFPGLLENLLGDNHWSVGGDLLLGLGDADQDPATSSVVWMPGAFFELEKRDLFGWGNRWAGLVERGDYRDDPRPDNYHVRAFTARVGLYVDLQNGRDTGWVKADAAIGLRYNVAGPRIPAHRFKETDILYLADEYRDQVLRQREQRRARMQESGADGSP